MEALFSKLGDRASHAWKLLSCFGAEVGMILLCAATSVEARACESGVRAAGASRFEVLKTGMGGSAATKALETRLKSTAHARPKLIVSTGFAGSWSPELSFASWALGHSIEKEKAQ